MKLRWAEPIAAPVMKTLAATWRYNETGIEHWRALRDAGRPFIFVLWHSRILPLLSLHRHDHGRTIVALKGGTLDVVDGSGATKEKMTWESGKAYWLGADAPNTQHGDLNKGTEPIEVIVVELKNDVKK